MLRRYILYLFRWQLSTPILAGVLILLSSIGNLWGTIVANFIGGLVFFWVDMFIFTSDKLGATWQVKENVECVDCGKIARGYRLVKTKNYDRTNAKPQFRCEKCSIKKAEELKGNGIEF